MDHSSAHIQVTVADGVAVATFDNPPVNIVSLALFMELRALADAVAADDAIRVLVLRSANPEFFLAHFDVQAILEFPTDGVNPRLGVANDWHRMTEVLRTMPKVTIACIAGRVGGGGSEIVQACDLRFGALGQMVMNQMEVPLGILPGGGGTQRLPRLVGRARALELILGGVDLDAATAERWGYLNRALPPEDLEDHVMALARRIAGFPEPAVRLAKQAVDSADRPLADGLADEAWLFQALLREPSAQAAMRAFLEFGGQTPEGERDVAALAARAAESLR